MPIDNRIESLNLKFQPIAQAWFEGMSIYVLPLRWRGYKAVVSETKRDAARQEEVKASGKSNLKLGFHNYGLAFDFLIIDDHGKAIDDGTHPAYTAAGKFAEALGARWGGDFGDYDHIQFPPGITTEQLIASMAAGKDLFA